MPPLVRRFLKTAILFLLFGIGLGVYMLVRRELDGAWASPWWISAHTHALLVGFVMMMILGVALWMFPPGPGGPAIRSASREAAYWFLTVGTAGRVAGELLPRPTSAVAGIRWTIVAGGAAQALGLAFFFWTMWSRIRGRPDG